MLPVAEFGIPRPKRQRHERHQRGRHNVIRKFAVLAVEHRGPVEDRRQQAGTDVCRARAHPERAKVGRELERRRERRVLPRDLVRGKEF